MLAAGNTESSLSCPRYTNVRIFIEMEKLIHLLVISPSKSPHKGDLLFFPLVGESVRRTKGGLTLARFCKPCAA